MGRWKPDAQGRLMRAAMELYAEHGYEQTTVVDIAQRAGVTERTFFRYFTDKREVLFEGATGLREVVVGSIVSAQPELPPMEVVGTAMAAGAAVLEENRDFARKRAAVIAANPGLQERELLKLASLAAESAAALRDRGVPEPAATLVAETGVTLFRVAFEKWIADTSSDSFSQGIRSALDQLKTLTAEG
jgi:AcrR family transcriptional regulator